MPTTLELGMRTSHHRLSMKCLCCDRHWIWAWKSRNRM